MLNKWIGMGRLTAKPELKTTPSGTSVTSFTIAVNRDCKSQNGEKTTDFLNIVAWRQTAEFVTKYFDKGNLILIEGSVNVRSYKDQSGQNRYITEIVADNAQFTGEKKEQSQANTATYTPDSYSANAKNTQSHTSAPQFEEITSDEDLPF